MPRPENGPASLPLPREKRPIKVVFPLFAGWGGVEGWETGMLGVGPGPRLEDLNWALLLVCCRDGEKFSGFKIVTSPRLPI